MIVADGMGGHRTGEVASQMATQTLVEAMSENRQVPPEAYLAPYNAPTWQCISTPANAANLEAWAQP